MAKSDMLFRMKADTQGYDANIAKARRQLDQFKKDNLSMGGVIKQLNGSLLSAAAGFASVTATVGAFSAAIKSNISTAAGFEKSMSQLSSLTGMVGSDLEKLKGYAIELGSSTTLSASQVADAFKMIGSQQPQLLASGEALKAVTKNAITLAEAAGIELADAAKTLSVSINQMGGDSNNAERYINVLAAASQKGAGDIVWLGEAITKSGTTAKAVGTDYEELVANLEQLAKAGYDASTAGTALRSIIMNLEKQANQQYKPSVVGLTEAFKNLGEANLTLTEYQGIAGKMFAAQAKALADAAGEAKNMKEEITGTNIAEEQAKTNTDNLDGSLKSLASAWEGLNLHINDSNGFLRTCVDWLKDVVVWADQAFTSAGRAQRQLLAMQGGGNGQPTKVDQQIAQLNSDNKTTNWSTYRGQVAGYNKEIQHLRDMASAWNEWRNGNRGTDVKKLIDESRDVYKTVSTAFLEQTAQNLEKMRDEYMSRALEIIKPKKTTTETPTPTPGSGGGSDKNKNKNTKKEVEVVSGSIGDYSKQIQELRKEQEKVTSNDAWQGLQDQVNHLNVLIKELKGELKVEPYDFTKDAQKMGADFDKEMRDKLSNPDKLIGPGLSKIVKEIAQPAKKEANLTQEIGKMAGGIQSIVGGIENLGVEIPEGMKNVLGGIQSMISILSGISAIVTAIEALSAADTIIPFAHGGIVKAAGGYVVPGNRYSGDLVPAALSSGELILNRAQQGVIAGALEGGAGRSVHVTGHLEGETIVLAADRYGRRTGKGELAFWK